MSTNPKKSSYTKPPADHKIPVPPSTQKYSKSQEKSTKKLQPKKIHKNITKKGWKKLPKCKGSKKPVKNHYNHSSTSNTIVKPPLSLFHQRNEVSPRSLPSSKGVSVKRKEFVQLVFKSRGTEKDQAHPYKSLQEYQGKI